MSAYPIEMGTLLKAMKAKLMDDSTRLPYVNDVRIFAGAWVYAPFNRHTVYITPLGSPETPVAEDTWYATHTVMVTAVSKIDNPEDEATVVGRTDAQVGITEFAADLVAFFGGNFLGLETAGLEPGVPPEIQAPANAYAAITPEDEDGNLVFLQTARLIYQAQTGEFGRDGT